MPVNLVSYVSHTFDHEFKLIIAVLNFICSLFVLHRYSAGTVVARLFEDYS